MRVWLKWTGIILLIPIALALSVSALFYIPPVQDAIIGKAAEYISKNIGMDIGFERIRLSFPLNLSARNVSVADAGHDTLLYLNKLTLQVRLKPLLQGNISVRGIRLEDLDFSTGKLLDGVVAGGHAGEVYLKADSIRPADAYALLNSVTLSDADVHLFVCDTTTADTSKSTTKWRIDLRKMELRNVAFSCRLPCDSVNLDLQIARAFLSAGTVDPETGRYEAEALLLDLPAMSYGTDLQEAAPGLDLSHINLSDVRLTFDSLYYESVKNMQARLTAGSARERSGLVFRSVKGNIASDSSNLHIPAFAVQTDRSTLQLRAAIPWAAVDRANPGSGNHNDSRNNNDNHSSELSLSLSASIGKEDLILVAGNMPDDFAQYSPDASLRIELSADGNVGELQLHRFETYLPGAFRMNMTGSVHSVADERRRRGHIRCNAETYDMAFVAKTLLPLSSRERFRVPDNMTVVADLSVDKGLYAVDATIREGKGRVTLSGQYDRFGNSYEASLTTDSLEPIHFMPGDSLMSLNVYVHAKGRGTDLYRPSTQAEMEGEIREISYGNISLSGFSWTGSLRNGHLQADVTSDCPTISGRISIDGNLQTDRLDGRLTVDVDTLDCYALGLTSMPLDASFRLLSEIATDWKKAHALDLTLETRNIRIDGQAIQPGTLTLALRSDEDTVRASIRSGDLRLMLTGNATVTILADRLTVLADELGKQLQHDSMPDFRVLRPLFPDISIRIDAGNDNLPFYLLQTGDLFFDTLNLNAAVSPEEGLRVDAQLLSLMKDTLIIDTLRLNVWQDTLGLQYSAGAIKKRFRNQEAFRAGIHGYVRREEADIFASYTDSHGKDGLLLGIHVRKTSDGFDFSLYPERPVIAFLPFTVNEQNYFRFKSTEEMAVDLRLTTSESQASLWIHSETNDPADREIMAELSQIDLQYLSGKFSFLPPLKGLLNASVRYEPKESTFMVIADADVDDLYYADGRIGQMLLNATYMPMERGTHQMDLHLFHDMSEITSLSVSYSEGKRENRINGQLSIDKLPLDMFNALLPVRTATLEGALSGAFAIAGTDAKPQIDGALQIDKGLVRILPSATTLRFDDKQITVTKNKIHIDNYKIYAMKDSPLVVDGFIDAADISRPTADLRMSATNLLLVDAKKSPENTAYGRLALDINTTLTGPLQSLRMRGTLHVLGQTNLTYVMLHSLPEVQDGFNDLVTFTYFADTLRTRRPFRFARRGGGNLAATNSMNVFLNLHIDPAVKMRVNLDEDQSNFVELKGGGNLSLQYTAQGDLRLNGRYTLSEGTIRYSIPVIPLTDFLIRNGSYVDWSGSPELPNLNITAYARVRSAVNVDGQKKMVDFNTGIQLRNNLGSISIQFILEAPTEAVVQNQLTSMSEEERSKQAISLLMTGVYLASGEGGRNNNLDVGMALSALLQREIKNILGSLLGDIPFSFDVDTYDGTQQGMGRRVDYIGRFYKSFLNERLNTTLGFRYSTKDPVYGNLFILDDISLEYLPGTDGTRSVKVFRKKEYENLFEGEIAKTGASYSFNRKVKRFIDLFTIRKPKEEADITEEEKEEETPPDTPERPESKETVLPGEAPPEPALPAVIENINNKK